MIADVTGFGMEILFALIREIRGIILLWSHELSEVPICG